MTCAEEMKKGPRRRENRQRSRRTQQSKTGLRVVRLIVVAGRALAAGIGGLTSCRPGVVLLAAAAMAPAGHATLSAALSGLGLDAAGDLVAIDGAGVDHGEVAAPLGLGAEGNVVAVDAAGDGD